VVHVGEEIQVTLLFPENVVLSVGRPVIFGTAAHNCLTRPYLNRRLMSVMWVWAFCGTSQLLNNRVLLRLRANRIAVILALLLFDCVMPSVNGCDSDEPKVDSVILQNIFILCDL